MLNLFVRYLLFGCVLLPEHPTDGKGDELIKRKEKEKNAYPMCTGQ